MDRHNNSWYGKLEHLEVNIAKSEAGELSEDLHESLRQHRWDRVPTEWFQ